MASKRKSTTPCMIPSKIIRAVSEVEQHSAVPLRQPKITGVGRRSPLDPGESSKAEAEDANKDGAGIYTCKPCSFETHDLNLFLDHVYTGHPEFRADPGFICLSCGVSAPKFEGLALHNARVHPSTLNTTLHLRKRERRVVVEQSLMIGTETCKDSEISITKTPIMRMLKGKSEPKRIVVPHAIPESSLEQHSDGKETPAVTVTHVPTIVHNGAPKVTMPSAIQIVNGSTALPLLKTPITQVVTVTQNRSLHSAPITASTKVSSASLSSSQNLPKVMIPLSSIPTYSASMDSSSFLKTSFSKFPYPTKAELCYLTVVTKFPEEQIKIWFTAQRLKQGISWSPEEIEEARRKMFNTIIQTAPLSSHSQAQSHHSPAAQTITVLPTSLGPTGIPQFLQGSLVSQGGVIVTQPVMANGLQVSSAPMALAVTPKPQTVARPAMQARPAAALAADKGGSVVVGSSSAGISIITSSKSGAGGSSSNGTGEAGAINLSMGSSHQSDAKASLSNGKVSNDVSSHVTTQSCDVNKPNSVSVVQSDGKTSSEAKAANSSSNEGHDAQKNKETNCSSNNSSSTSTDEADPPAADSPSAKVEEAASPASKCSSPCPAAPPGSTSGSRTSNLYLDPSFNKGKKSQEQLGALKDSFLKSQWPDQDEVDRLISLTGLTVREVRKWFSDRRYHLRNLKGARSGPAGHSGRAGAASGSASGASTPESAAGPVDLSESGSSGSGAKTPQHNSCPAAAQSPPRKQTPTSPMTPSRRFFRIPSPDFTAIRYKERDPHQILALESSFSQNPDPSEEEVDRLRSDTKMTRREIHGWFAERRKRVAAEKKKEEVEQTLREDEEGTELDGDDGQKDDGEPKVNPIKINLKMLKVTEASGKLEADGSDSPVPPTQASANPKPSTPTAKTAHAHKPATVRGKKTTEQLHLLKQVYARTQWPSAAQYDELLSGTGLPRPEVVRWFGDSRYVQKNGQLKWLEEYQNAALEEDLKEEKVKIFEDHLETRGRLEESQLHDLAEQAGVTVDLARHWFSVRAKQSSARTSAVVTPTRSSPSIPQAGGETEKVEPSVCGVAAKGTEEAFV